MTDRTQQQMTDAEWARQLSADDCLALVHHCIEERDMEGAATALRLLAVKDPEAAALVVGLVEVLRG